MTVSGARRLVLDTNIVVAGLLLPIGVHQNIAIVTAREALDRIEAKTH